MTQVRVACAVLAAGASRRLGYPKQLLTVRGEPLVTRVARACRDSDCCMVSVVVGAYAPLVANALRGLGVQVLTNLGWEHGIASSIGRAVRWASDLRFDALIVTLCDQPALDRYHLNALVSGFERTRKLVASHYAGERGAPVLFPARYFGVLLRLSGDVGAQSLVRHARGVLEIEWSAGALDIDLPWQVPLARLA